MTSWNTGWRLVGGVVALAFAAGILGVLCAVVGLHTYVDHLKIHQIEAYLIQQQAPAQAARPAPPPPAK